jgi:3-hydroxybutyryl-CoA dehydratase
MCFEELKIGMSYTISKAFSSEEVNAFSVLSMDNNPLHTNDAFAQKSIFGKKIVHGFLTASLFSAIIGTKFPGEGSIYLNQNLSFLRPVFHNQVVFATVTVKELYPEKHRLLLDTICKDENGIVLITGTALVKLV